MNEYFLGGASPKGFRTHFGEILFDASYYAYIIKGGPGTGKSSLMKRIAETFTDEDTEIYHCSSDPDSLDAVVLKDRRAIFVDGTAPHTFDPEYPGAAQTILDLGACWDDDMLKNNRDGIISETEEYLRCHASCKRFITALAAVADDTFGIGMLALNEEKLSGFTERLSAKLLPQKRGSEGRVSFRQLSALTPKGYITYLPEDCTVYLLNDSLFAGSEAFLRQLSEIAAKRGYEVSVSICTICGEELFEHILIPELKLAFMSATPINELETERKQPVNFRRFYDKSVIRSKKPRLRFNAAAMKDLRGEAVQSLVRAKEKHDELERFYIEAVDFKKTDKIADKLIKELSRLT